ncbi:MAG: FHA domain-containing protein [Myxococcota bacterium]
MASSGYVLKFISGKYQGGEMPLDDNREYIIGRKSDIDIVIVEDMVSRMHAKITLNNGQIYIQDLGSTNGTFVNGERIKRVRLKEGDRILVGTSLFRLERGEVKKVVGQVKINKAVVKEEERHQPQQVQRKTTLGGPSINQGTLTEIPMADLLQMISVSKKSGVLVIKSLDEGKIFFKSGHINYACINENHQLNPVKAIYRIITWDKGSYRFDPPDNRKFVVEIDEDLDVLLMEALRQRDELKKLAGQIPPPNRSLTLNTPISPPLKELKPEYLDILQLIINYGQIKAVMDKSPLTDIEVAKAIAFMLSKGYIREA